MNSSNESCSFRLIIFAKTKVSLPEGTIPIVPILYFFKVSFVLASIPEYAGVALTTYEITKLFHVDG